MLEYHLYSKVDWLQSETLFCYEEFAIIMKFLLNIIKFKLLLVRCFKQSHQIEKMFKDWSQSNSEVTYIANSMGPDQTAPSVPGSSLISDHIVCFHDI